MEWYILKSVAILATLLLFYKLLLEKENMHIFKRFYLLFAVVASVGIPLVTITTYVEPGPGNFEPILFTFSEEASVAENRSFTDYLPFILWTIYAMGVIFFSLKFIRNLRELLLKIKTNPKIKKGGCTRILLSEKIDPHTFFSYIFLNRKKYAQEQIPKEVIIHEEAHAQQKHSLDVLLLELFQIIFWINPLIILLKDAVKLNHEFLADKAVIKEGIQTAGYQYTLLSFSSGHLQSDLVNPINYSSIKKRFTIMKTHTSKSTILVKGLLILPLISILLFSFSNKETLEKEMNSRQVTTANSNILILEVDNDGQLFLQENKIPIEELDKHIKKRNYTLYQIEVAENSSPSIMKDLIHLMAENKLEGSVATCTSKQTEQEKATPEMIAEHNRLVKFYNSIPEEEFKMKQEDANRIMFIRSRMTTEQKNKAEKIRFEILPPPPPKPQTPPSPPTFEKLLADGAIFYYKGNTIESQKARELVEDQKKVNVEITYKNHERPIVKLTGKKN
ncbi:M56 family metallopeptidase [Salegentibacter sp. JZCK2]|uniref:M56 family metallopeptidase n=1 Tax=Salegentibacter tibetensis TaxID=2873600 RepID=UPI001CCAE9F3|nr:M56 family metallopeptidase [Salegentibacter tibetensis]MBZ9728607.1 M56 family metallopeptidase [Salegentibacter tibetensis]